MSIQQFPAASGGGAMVRKSVVLTTSQAWACPAGVYAGDVYLLGGGGGGATGNNGFGGGSGYGLLFKNVDLTGTNPVIIGAGGASGADGGSTSFKNCLAPGGSSGATTSVNPGSGGSGGGPYNGGSAGSFGGGTRGIISLSGATVSEDIAMMQSGGGGGGSATASAITPGGKGMYGTGGTGSYNSGGGNASGYGAGGGSCFSGTPGVGTAGLAIISWEEPA